MCDHRYLDDPRGLLCDRETAHDPEARGGHTYSSSTASQLGEGRGHREPRSEDQ